METNYNQNIFKENLSVKQLSLNKKKLLFIIIALILLLGVLILIFFGSKFTPSLNTSADSRTQIQPAKTSREISREFSFPLKDNEGKDVSSFKYVLESAELRDEIVIQGQKATSVKGRTFLIINLKLVNDYSKAISVNTRDFIRISFDNSKDNLLAADIHNDPVTVQPMSAKFTRLGLPINDNDKNISLFIGELDGEKIQVDIKFK
jgi:hypothetical protein